MKETIMLNNREYKLVKTMDHKIEGWDALSQKFEEKGLQPFNFYYVRINRGREYKEVIENVVLTTNGEYREF